MKKIITAWLLVVLVALGLFYILKPKTIKLGTAYIEHDGEKVIKMEWRK